MTKHYIFVVGSWISFFMLHKFLLLAVRTVDTTIHHSSFANFHLCSWNSVYIMAIIIENHLIATALFVFHFNFDENGCVSTSRWPNMMWHDDNLTRRTDFHSSTKIHKIGHRSCTMDHAILLKNVPSSLLCHVFNNLDILSNGVCILA